MADAALEECPVPHLQNTSLAATHPIRALKSKPAWYTPASHSVQCSPHSPLAETTDAPRAACEAMPGAALDAQSILRLARRVNSTRIRVEPDTSSPVDDDVRAGRWPRLRVGVDKARHAVRALDALDHRIMLSRRVRRLCPSTGHTPTAGNTARHARHALFPKFRSAQLLRQHNQTPARCPVEVEAGSAYSPMSDWSILCTHADTLYTSRRLTSRWAVLILPDRSFHGEQLASYFTKCSRQLGRPWASFALQAAGALDHSAHCTRRRRL